MLKPYLNNVSGKSKQDIILFSGGLNATSDKAFIKDEQLSYMMNVGLYNSPTLETRPGRTSFAFYMENFSPNKVLKMFASTSGRLYTVEEIQIDPAQPPAPNKKLFRYIMKDGAIEREEVGTLNSGNIFSITECRDAKHSYIVVSACDTTAINNPAHNPIDEENIETQSANVESNRYQFYDENVTNSVEIEDQYAGVLATHKNRLWIGNGKSLKFSNLRQYNDFTISEDDTVNTAGEIFLTDSKGNITALVSYDDKLIIFCEYSIHVLYGDSPNSEINQFSLVSLSNDVGCISDEAYTICDRCLYWVDLNANVYRYNGSYIIKISEPYGNDNYASYGGISQITIDMYHINNVAMSNIQNRIYIAMRNGVAYDSEGNETSENNVMFVYDTRNRVWWAEDGSFSHLVSWNTYDNTKGRYSNIFSIVGSTYEKDVLIFNREKAENDVVYEPSITEENMLKTKDVEIEFDFETKVWTLGTIKKKKTLTNVWFDADANAEVGVADYLHSYNKWNTFIVNVTDEFKHNFMKIGTLKRVGTSHQIYLPTNYLHEGKERQRCIIPKMYMQKINAFSIRVRGKGHGEFYMLEKEWRVK